MIGDGWEALPQARQAEVLAAVAAVETAQEPVPANELRALLEPALRQVVEQVLARSGRVLLQVGNGYLSGYADPVAGELADLGIGILEPEHRAVLAMVLLFTVAVPRAEGRHRTQNPWLSEHPVAASVLETGAVRPSVVKAALSALRSAGLIRTVNGGIVPGWAFLRLTPGATTVLFEELILLAEPHGDLAMSIRRLRTHAADPDRKPAP
ncbi:hypothetical protein [Nocardia sp. XZ_19_231]|uniref:hypothetical protein n=1 Tax=Nocardia sp. XZ_19_231 TaxID=2769252 RepID=UPI001890AD82|nr:hypothetical protein [Nocardia sp. XZ_19_231]